MIEHVGEPKEGIHPFPPKCAWKKLPVVVLWCLGQMYRCMIDYFELSYCSCLHHQVVSLFFFTFPNDGVKFHIQCHDKCRSIWCIEYLTILGVPNFNKPQTWWTEFSCVYLCNSPNKKDVGNSDRIMLVNDHKTWQWLIPFRYDWPPSPPIWFSSYFIISVNPGWKKPGWLVD